MNGFHVTLGEELIGAHRFRCMDVLSLVEYEVLNRLTALSGRHIGFRPIDGAKSTGQERATRLMLNVGGVRTVVYFAGRDGVGQHGWYAFDDLLPAERAELWALRVSRLRCAFERLFAAPVSIGAVAVEAVPMGWSCVSLRLGWLEIPCWFEAAAAARALASAQPHRQPTLPSLSRLPVVCALRLRAVRVGLDEYRTLARGDVVLVARDASAPMRGELIAPGFGYRYPMTYRKEGAVMIEQDEIKLDEQDVTMELEDRHVELSVELAICRLTLGELANLRAGQMLRLAKAADEMSVDIRYRGTRVARGSLVEINGLLGVRIDAVGMDASA
ncbi:FliM/FliN family flagellar motor switch protein [Burkholderia ambifaria]|uniref:Surface presentation of antigens (SPOA) protein n=1 Tax=Burkholderia ambifaria MEX-5 TaxID=396597 RepID=B1T6T2_9BURK|nr:FliM/FliN family flagellar motor switch protein [Burkholderia ambifaria]EDT40725.1 surface presentation of antigens (SPOA) protein [Burkholderia ambifaria MEX-5]